MKGQIANVEASTVIGGIRECRHFKIADEVITQWIFRVHQGDAGAIGALKPRRPTFGRQTQHSTIDIPLEEGQAGTNVASGAAKSLDDEGGDIVRRSTLDLVFEIGDLLRQGRGVLGRGLTDFTWGGWSRLRWFGASRQGNQAKDHGWRMHIWHIWHYESPQPPTL